MHRKILLQILNYSCIQSGLAETTRLFTQLWASLQSGEADGGQTVPQMILNIFTKIHEMLHILTI